MTQLIHGDCLEKLKDLPDNSVDSIVTDPPYGLSFMGKHWDYDVPSTEIWKECLRVLKPGGHLLSFAGTRTQHRMAVNIEDAGFEIRDMIAWIYSTGFPKSLNVYKQFEKMCTCGNMEAYELQRTAQESKHNVRPLQDPDISQEVTDRTPEGEVLQSGLQEQSIPTSVLELSNNEGREKSSLEGRYNNETPERELQRSEVRPLPAGVSADGSEGRVYHGTPTGASSTPESDSETRTGGASHRPQPLEQFTGEPCSFCKQYGAQEVRARASEIYGFGTALKPALEPITVARKPIVGTVASNVLEWGTGGINVDGCRVGTDKIHLQGGGGGKGTGWGKKEAINEQRTGRFPANLLHDGSEEVVGLFPGESDKSAARFFYCAKASKKDRDEGLDGFATVEKPAHMRTANGTGEKSMEHGFQPTQRKNHHPTVKPTDLMRYLCRLVTPKGGTVLDPFMGSGSTGKAAKLEGFDFIGIEREAEYIEIARARIDGVQPTLL